MKKINLYSIAMAALLLGACSDDNVPTAPQEPTWNSNGEGYVSLAIQLPTQPKTRAAFNDGTDLRDGTPAEYEVKDATLILFSGENDNDMKVNSAYTMKLNFRTEGDANDHITSTAKITQKINEMTAKKIKALVVLNNNGIFTVSTKNELKIGQNVFNGTLAELNEALKNVDDNYSWHDKGWLMSNAVMTDKPGGTDKPEEAKVTDGLVEISKTDNIKPSKTEAETVPVTIYVERAESKVTVKADIADSDRHLTTDATKTYEIMGWALDNTSKLNYLVRDTKGFTDWSQYTSHKLTSGTSDYRFVGNKAIVTSLSLYRVYWSTDANYSGTITAADNYKTAGGAHAILADLKQANGTDADYCFENTTDVAAMLEQNLTRVIVKAKFNDGNAFYTVDNDRTKMWTEDDVKKEIAARLLNAPAVHNWATENLNGPDKSITPADFEVTLSNEDAGVRTVTAIKVKDEKFSGDTFKSGAKEKFPTNAVELANGLIDLAYYEGGFAYYPVYVRHFDEEQTPWKREYATAEGVYGPADAAQAENYLGRYGVVRNNWYEVNVTAIKSLGEPNVPVVSGNAPDKNENYITVAIKVLSWAKRGQDVVLGE